MPIKAVIFDAYGTLFDLHCLIPHCDFLWPGHGTAISRTCRAKQLEYSWLRSLMGRYVEFETITADALRYACKSLALPCEPDHIQAIVSAYRTLATFPEVNDVMSALGAYKRAILSNGSPAMLSAMVRNAGLEAGFHAVLSVDALKIYKPDPRVYHFAMDVLDLQRHEVAFVSANCWDACGAESFGFPAFWINRTGAAVDLLGATAEHELTTLAEIIPFLA
jgi:2-haloacid dehalogenase